LLGGGNDKVNSSETLGSVSNGQSSRQSTPAQAASTLYSQVKEIKAHGFAFLLSFFCLLALLCAPFAGCEEQVLLFLIKGQRCECSKIQILFIISHIAHLTHPLHISCADSDWRSSANQGRGLPFRHTGCTT
jgi:hypothetical protein